MRIFLPIVDRLAGSFSLSPYIMRRIKIILSSAIFILLAFLIGIQVFAYLTPPPDGATDNPPVATLIPSELNGWMVEDIPLGPTESVTERSLILLNLNDFVQRQYSNAGTSFSVYVAYWGPGKMPIRLVSQHTPDRCWTENGWTCTDRKFNVEKQVGKENIQPAQWGEYKIHEYTNQAYFWHVVDGEVKWYAGNRMNTRTTIKSVLLDVMNFTLNNKPDQYFVRIVSQDSLDELWELPAFQEVMQSLSDLCLAFPEKPL